MIPLTRRRLREIKIVTADWVSMPWKKFKRRSWQVNQTVVSLSFLITLGKTDLSSKNISTCHQRYHLQHRQVHAWVMDVHTYAHAYTHVHTHITPTSKVNLCQLCTVVCRHTKGGGVGGWGGYGERGGAVEKKDNIAKDLLNVLSHIQGWHTVTQKQKPDKPCRMQAK